MSKASNGNVVALGDHPRARARLSPQESAGVLTDCRELALDRIAKSLSGMLDRVEDDLFELTNCGDVGHVSNADIVSIRKSKKGEPLVRPAPED